jgi:hypothetical protein
MNNFKKLIKESYIGNPLNEVNDSKTVSTKHLDAIIYEDGGVKLRINSSNKSPYGYTKRDLIKSPFGVSDEEFTFDYIKEEIDEVYTKFPDEEIKELLLKVTQHKNSLNEEDRATRVDKMLSRKYNPKDYKDDEYYDDVRADLEDEINENKFDDAAMDEYGKPFDELSIAQKQEMLSYMNRETEKQFQTDYERRRRGDYSDDRDDGMTDYQRRRMDEEFKKGDKVTYLGNPGKITFVGKDVMGDIYYSVAYDRGTGRTKVSNLYNKGGEIKAVKEDINEDKYFSLEKGDKLKVPHPIYKNLTLTITNPKGSGYEYYSKHDEGGIEKGWAEAGYFSSAIEKGDAELIKAVKEDINDPVLVKTRAAQMKRDAMDKKDLENKSKRISVDKAIDLRYELSILDKEREDILMRIEDIGVEMDQTAEPEGGPIADKLGERLMAAQRELRAVNNKIIDVRDELGDFDMNESDLDEGNGGAKQDDEINLNVSNANDIADEEEAHSGVLELRNKLKENLTNRLK